MFSLVREEFEELSAQHSYCPPRHKHAQSRENEVSIRLSYSDSTAFLNSGQQLGHAFLFVVQPRITCSQASVGCLFKTPSANWMELSY